MSFDSELVRILNEKYDAELKQHHQSEYNCFIFSDNLAALGDIAKILILNKIDFEYGYEDTLILGKNGLKKLKFALRKLILDGEDY